MKKPSASATLYLRAAAENQIAKVEPLPPTKANWQEYERLRDLIKRIRRMAGFSPWWPIGAATASCILLIVAASRYAPKSQSFNQPDDYFRVISRVDDYNITFQQIHKGIAMQPVVMFFCKDGEGAPFEPGHTLTAFGIDYYPTKFCHAVTRFSLLRDSATCPIVPRNCRHTNCADPLTDHVLCEGRPQFD